MIDNSNLGRQPKPVTVTFSGDDPIDILYWMRRFIRNADASADEIHKLSNTHFIIYPRAIND